MLTPGRGRLLIIALVVHFALLLPITEMAHGAGHSDDGNCGVCLQLGSLQQGVAPSVAVGTAPPDRHAPVQAMTLAATPTAPTRATARGPPGL